MDQSCSMPHGSLTLQEMCILMKLGRGTSSACVQMGLSSVCRWNIPTWAVRHQTTHVEKLTRRLDWNLLHLSTVTTEIRLQIFIYRTFYKKFMKRTYWYLCCYHDKFYFAYFICQTGMVLQIIATWPKIFTYLWSIIIILQICKHCLNFI